MEWISVKDRSPKIPERRYAVTILVAVFDSVYEEINPGRGSSVETMSFGLDGKFKTLAIGGINESEWIESCDPVTHWMPMPEPPVVGTG